MAREFTERWHHQQQIRLATQRPGTLTREFYAPMLATFMRALPFHYRAVAAPPGCGLRFDVTGECGGSWHLLREATVWRLSNAASDAPLATVAIPQEIAWRVFTKGIERPAAQAQTTFTGDAELALHVLSMLAIVS